MTDEDRLLAWRFSQEATKEAERLGRDRFLMMCELFILSERDVARQWVEAREPKTTH